MFPQILRKCDRADKCKVRKVVLVNASNMQYADDSLKKDKSFVLSLLIEGSNIIFNYIDPLLKNDKEIIYSALCNNNVLGFEDQEIIESVGDDIKRDREFIISLIKNGARIFKYLPPLSR